MVVKRLFFQLGYKCPKLKYYWESLEVFFYLQQIRMEIARQNPRLIHSLECVKFSK